jgi:hypothetical protein
MKIYKDEEGLFYAFEEDGSQDFLIKVGMVQITNEEHIAELETKKQTYLNDRTYNEKRIAEYPLIFEYIDGVVKGDQAQINKYIADCLSVKAKYPKPD